MFTYYFSPGTFIPDADLTSKSSDSHYSCRSLCKPFNSVDESGSPDRFLAIGPEWAGWAVSMRVGVFGVQSDVGMYG